VSLAAIILASYLSITIPITDSGIPFTAQSWAVFLVSGLLSPRQFLAVILVYLVLGMLGLPVFADGTSGVEKLAGGSGGFLYGFVFSGFFISWAITKYRLASFSEHIGVMLLATVVLFLFGLGHLAGKFGMTKALEYGLYPFWKMALVKALLAALYSYI